MEIVILLIVIFIIVYARNSDGRDTSGNGDVG